MYLSFSAGRVPLFSAPHLPAPPLPPENIMTEQDRQTQLHYEGWLNHQNQIVSSQLKYYETEVSKLRKIRKVNCSNTWEKLYGLYQSSGLYAEDVNR